MSGRRFALGLFALTAVLASGIGLAGAVAAPIAHTYVVNDTADRVDASPGVNGCQTAAGTCSLRAAIQEANAAGGTDRIVVPPGLYELEIPPINENAANVGDFEIIDPVVIDGAGQGLTIIDGGRPLPGVPPEQHGMDRLFEIHPGAGDVTIRNLTLREGFSDERGGAIQNWSPGKLRLEQVTVRDSYATEAGGGLNNADIRDYEWPSGDPPIPIVLAGGRVEIVDSIFTGNGSGGTGAAINNVSSGSITISGGSRSRSTPARSCPIPSSRSSPSSSSTPAATTRSARARSRTWASGTRSGRSRSSTRRSSTTRPRRTAARSRTPATGSSSSRTRS